MPKKYFDLGTMDPSMGPDKPMRKTERSHEENQERAYIAASRRADRSIEARVQSARMASEIHKKRTGKAFRITEEIVMKEEMYEEEEDDFPRSYRLLGPQMQTSSADMNSRVETYLTNRVAMSKLLTATEQDWRENAINRAFAQTFPNADRHAQSLSQRWSTPGFEMPSAQTGRLQSPIDPSFNPNFQPIAYGTGNPQNERSRSMSVVSPTDLDGESNLSPPALTPGSGSHPETPQSQPSTVFSGGAGTGKMDFAPDGSVFTSELPPEAKMLLGAVDMNESFAPAAYGQDWMSDSTSMYTYPDLSKPMKAEDGQVGADLYMEGLGSMEWEAPVPLTNPEEPSWDAFINDNAWGTEHQ